MGTRKSAILVKQDLARLREFRKEIKAPEDPEVVRERSRQHIPTVSEAKKLFYSHHRFLRKARKKAGLYVPDLKDALAVRAGLVRSSTEVLPDRRAKEPNKRKVVVSDKAGGEEHTGMGHAMKRWLGVAR